MDTHNEGEDSLDDETLEDIVVAATSVATAAAFIYANPLFNNIPYHTSSLSLVWAGYTNSLTATLIAFNVNLESTRMFSKA